MSKHRSKRKSSKEADAAWRARYRRESAQEKIARWIADRALLTADDTRFVLWFAGWAADHTTQPVSNIVRAAEDLAAALEVT